jgi:hypothetical protein
MALVMNLAPLRLAGLSAGDGAKGPRFYEWAWVEIDPDQPGHRWLLIRRNTSGELAYYRC